MAVTGVRDPGKPAHRGGGGFWGTVGTALGAVAGGIIGTIAAPGAGTMAGASLGSTLGGVGGQVGGEMADPARQATTPGDIAPTNIKRLDLALKVPQVQMAQMQRSKELLAQSNVPNALDYMKEIDKAQQLLKKQQGEVPGYFSPGGVG